MPCTKCQPFYGHSTTHVSAFSLVFIVTESHCSSMTEYGLAVCKHCMEIINFDYDETLIPKLRITTLDQQKQAGL